MPLQMLIGVTGTLSEHSYAPDYAELHDDESMTTGPTDALLTKVPGSPE